MTAFTPDTIRNIAKYAGILPPQVIADRLGFALAFVQRVAREQNLDLCVPIPSIDPQQPPAETRRPQGRPARLTEAERRHTIAITLRSDDIAILREKAATRFVKPAKLLAQIIEGAISRGWIDELAAASKSYRPGISDAEP